MQQVHCENENFMTFESFSVTQGNKYDQNMDFLVIKPREIQN